MGEQGYAVVRSLGQQVLFGGKRPRLGHLDLELTERCNNACLHCYINLPAGDARAARRELSTAEWKDVLGQAAALGALWVRVSGGEPLLRPDFPELYLHARRLGLKVVLFTNARLITPELADLLARVPPLRKVEISVYGMQASSYDAVARSPGGFTEFRRGVKLLWERQVPFVVKSVLLPPNRDEIPEFERWAATIPWMEESPTYAVLLDLRARRDSEPRNRLIRRLRFSPEEALALAARRGDAHQRGVAQFGKGFLGPQGERLFACGAGEAGCVDAYGGYQMCTLLRQPEMVYDLRQGSLGEALEHAFPAWRARRATNPDYLARCARCFLKGLCEQCPGKSWAEHGTLDTPVEYLCRMAHAEARAVGTLGERRVGVGDRGLATAPGATGGGVSGPAEVEGARPVRRQAPVRRTRVRLARGLLRLGGFVQSLAVVVMRPDDLAAFSRESYAQPESVASWAEDGLVDSGLSDDEMALLAAVPPVAGGELLLLGVGGGREAIPLARLGYHVTGVDYVAAMVERAQANAARRGVHIDGLVQEISQLDVPAEAYDIVWLSRSMYSCVPTRGRRVGMVQRIARALKPGGVFLCQFQWRPDLRTSARGVAVRRALGACSLGNVGYEAGDMLWGHAEFVHAFASEDAVRDELEAGGLSVLCIRTDPRSIRAGAAAKKGPTAGEQAQA